MHAVHPNGKPVRASLDADVFSTVTQKLPDKLKELRNPKVEVGTFADGRLQFEETNQERPYAGRPFQGLSPSLRRTPAEILAGPRWRKGGQHHRGGMPSMGATARGKTFAAVLRQHPQRVSSNPQPRWCWPRRQPGFRNQTVPNANNSSDQHTVSHLIAVETRRADKLAKLFSEITSNRFAL